MRGPAGRAMAEEEGRSPLRNLAAAALRTPRAASGPPRCPTGTSSPPCPTSAVRVRPPPGGSAEPPGCARPVPPLPHPAAGWGVTHLPRCPRLPCPARPPRPASRAPAPAAAHHLLGRGKAQGRSHAAVRARPKLAEAGPARSAAAPPLPLRRARAPQPRPAPSGGRRAPASAPPPAGGVLLRARGRRAPGPSSPALTPRSGGRARSLPVRGNPERRARRFGARRGPLRPSSSPPPSHAVVRRASAAAARDHLAGVGERNAWRVLLQISGGLAPRDPRACGSSLRLGLGAAFFQRVPATPPRSGLPSPKGQAQGLTMFRTLVLS